MKPRHSFIVALLGGGLLFANQFVFPFAVPMRDDLAYAQEQQRGNTGPKKDGTPQTRACGGSPARYPTHDAGDLVIVSGVTFLLGFRLVARMERRQTARLTRLRR